jgi:hypothetical protein
MGWSSRPLSTAVNYVCTVALVSIFNCGQQDQVTRVVYTMTAFRKWCVSLQHGAHFTVNTVQPIVEEDVELVLLAGVTW